MEDNNQNSIGTQFLANAAFSFIKRPALLFLIMPIFIFILIILVIVIFGGRTSAMEGISNASGAGGSGGSSGGVGCMKDDASAWANFLSDEKEATTFYNRFNKLLEDNPSVDFSTAAAILTYGTPPDVEDRFACNEEEKNDQGKVTKEECTEAAEGSTKSATTLYDDATTIVKGLASVESDDESVKKWLKEKYLNDKLEDLGYDFSKSSDEQKEALFERTANEMLELRDQYKSMTCGDEKVAICDASNSVDSSTKKKVRITSYQYAVNAEDNSLGGLGTLEPYIKAGTVYFDDNNFAFWKGGNSRLGTSTVYGEPGKDYLILAAAHKGLIGQYGYEANELIHYYEYGDTFSITLTVNGSEKTYNAIILDACGACMDWSVTSNGKYSPKKDKDKKYCAETNNIKLDILTGTKGAKSKSDTGYIMDGTSNNNACIISGNFEHWKQVDPRWSSVKIGKSSETVGSVGCAITSVSIQIMRSGTKVIVPNFDPGKAAQLFRFDGADFYWYSTINVAPNFQTVGDGIDMTGLSKLDQMTTIKNLINEGYYVVANVKNGGHWVAVTGVTNDTIVMSDPGSFNAGTDLYAAYPSSNSALRMVKIRYYKKMD